MSHTSNMRRHARKGTHQMERAARDLKSSAENHAGSIVHTFQQMGADATDAVKDGIHDLRETAGDYVEQGRATVHSLEKSVEKRIQERPLTAVLIGVGVGFLAGFFYSRR